MLEVFSGREGSRLLLPVLLPFFHPPLTTCASYANLILCRDATTFTVVMLKRMAPGLVMHSEVPPPADRQGRHLRSPSSRYLCTLVISARQSAFFFNGLSLMFAFKGQRAVFYNRLQRGADIARTTGPALSRRCL